MNSRFRVLRLIEGLFVGMQIFEEQKMTRVGTITFLEELNGISIINQNKKDTWLIPIEYYLLGQDRE